MRIRFGRAPGSRHSGISAWLWSLGLSLSGFSLTAWLAPYSPVSPLIAYCVGFACVVGVVIASAMAAPLERRVCAVAAIGGMLAWLIVRQIGADAWGGLAIFAALLLLGSAVGAWVGGGIEQPGHLLFVAIVSSLADAWSVGHPAGPSAQIAQHAETLSLLALPWPMLGTHDVVPLLGVGDVVFTSLYWSAARRHALPMHRTLLAMFAAYAITAATVIVFARPIPVLPLLGAGMLLVHPVARKPTGHEARRAAWLMAVFAVGMAFWVLQRAL